MSSFSWQSHDDELARRLDAQRGRQQQAEADRARALAEGKAQRELVTTKIVGPFLDAMRAAGNPGRERRLRGWRGGPADEAGRNTYYTSGPQLYFEVRMNGYWLYGTTAGDLHRQNDTTQEAWRYSSAFGEGERATLSTEQLRNFQAYLVEVLRTNRVPLPRD